jgi:hypothetical protein
MTWSTYARAGRSEFNRVFVASLTASVESQVERHRAKRHRLRLRRAERRLAELRHVGAPGAEAAAQPQAATDAARPIAAFVTATAAWFGSAAILALCLALHLEAAVTGVADLSLLMLTLLWFVLAVACSPKLG